MFQLLHILPLVAIASAAPAKSAAGSCKAVQELATFDDLTTLPAISQLTNVGTYDGLEYQSFKVLQAGIAGVVVTGVKPQSGSQVAAAGQLITPNAPAFIPAAPYKTLDLRSLYFGCVINDVESVAGVPEQCTVAFTAYLPGSEEAYQTINEQFNPTSALESNMVKATFPSTWIGMGKIEIVVVAATSSPTLTGLFIDNVQYAVYKC